MFLYHSPQASARDMWNAMHGDMANNWSNIQRWFTFGYFIFVFPSATTPQYLTCRLCQPCNTIVFILPNLWGISFFLPASYYLFLKTYQTLEYIKKRAGFIDVFITHLGIWLTWTFLFFFFFLVNALMYRKWICHGSSAKNNNKRERARKFWNCWGIPLQSFFWYYFIIYPCHSGYAAQS